MSVCNPAFGCQTSINYIGRLLLYFKDIRQGASMPRSGTVSSSNDGQSLWQGPLSEGAIKRIFK